MTVRQDITGIVNNDLQYTFSLTRHGKPLDLTGYSVTVVVKPSQSSADSAGTTYAIGSGLVILSTTAGRIQLNIPRASTAAAGATWYRLSLSNGSQVVAAMCGVLNLTAA